jgi:hypothetical protein
VIHTIGNVRKTCDRGHQGRGIQGESGDQTLELPNYGMLVENMRTFSDSRVARFDEEGLAMTSSYAFSRV